MGTKSDEELINSFLATGDRSLIDDLFRRYRSLVFGVCTKFLDNKSDSMDATMTVFEKILRFKSEKEIHDFPNWLFTMTKHTCLDYHQRKQREKINSKDFQNFRKNEKLVVENEDANRLLSVEDKEIDEIALKEALEKLKPDQRICIELFYYKKMRYKVIEEETGIPEKQIKSLLQNGKRKLKRLLLQQKTRKWRNDQ